MVYSPESGDIDLFPLLFVCVGRKKPSGKASKVRDDNAKELFEIGEWARDEVTFDRVGKSVLMYSFIKDGLSRGERVDDKVSCISSGCTFRVTLHDFLFEDKDKKSGGEGSRNVFPSDIDVIPPFSVVEIAVHPGNSGSFDDGWGLNVARVRPCAFTLYSMMTPLGLSLLHPTHAKSTSAAEATVEVSPGLRRVVEPRNTGFFGQATQGSYIVKYSEDVYRLVGPKQDPADPLSRHDDALSGGVFAVDINKADLMRFTNAVEEEEEDSLLYAQFVVDLAASAGALNLYVVHNEYLLRKDPNRSPFAGVPLLDTAKLLACVTPAELSGGVSRFPLQFHIANMEEPFLKVDPACVDNNSGGDAVQDLPCADMVLASENARVRSAYPLSLGDRAEEDIMCLLFVPKSRSSGGGGGGRGGLDRLDYRLLKKQRTTPAGAE